MAQVIQLQTSMPTLQQFAQKICDAYHGLRADETNWMVKCPIHDDNHASLHIEVTDRLLAYCHVCGKSKQNELIAKIKEDGLWPIEGVNSREPKEESDKSNIPAHGTPFEFPKYLTGSKGKYEVTKIWTYYTATGHPAFWVVRADVGKEKLIKPYSSFTIDGEDKFKMGLKCDNRPLYNLPAIVNNPTKPVIVVEGEKSADAAQLLFPDYVATCWSGGVNGLSNTNVMPLIGRDVTMWADNDAPGITAMGALARLLAEAPNNPSPKIVFQELTTKFPEKWDVADKSAFIPSELLLFIKEAKEYVINDIEKSNTLKFLLNKWQKVEDGSGGTAYYDVNSRSHNRRPEQPFKMYSSAGKLQEAEPLYEIININEESKRVRIIDKYILSNEQPHAAGLIFDPTTKNVRISKGSTLYLNTFMGIENEPKECNEDLYKPFIDHIQGTLDQEPAEYMLNFFSDIFQNIAVKPGVMPIIKGKPGTGKSIIGEAISAMLGSRIACSIPCGAVFDSTFNGRLSHKIFISLDELNLYGAGNKNANETLKVMITDPYFSVNKKFVNQLSEKSYHRYMATTNIDYAVHIDTSDRRYAVFVANDKYIGNYEHFNKIGQMMLNKEALSGLAFFLKSRQITKNIKIIPQTEARALIQKPEDPIIGLLFSWLNDATLPAEIRAQLINSGWPEKPVLIHRSIINEYINKKHPSLSGLRLTTKLLDHIKWKRPDGDYNNMVRLETYDPITRSTVKEKERAYEFMPVLEQRRIYEAITGTMPTWSPITFIVDDPKDNVVPIKEVF